MTGVFAPLSVLASEGDGAVDNPYVLMFLFQCGQLTAIPFLMFYYSKFFTTGAKHDTHGKIWQYVEALLELPQPDFKYGCCAGVAVGLGFFLFFSAADVLPSTITFGISNCAPLVTISVDVFVFGHLDNATLWQTRFMIISTTLFASAIVQMVLAQSI
jgi:drug/metabolite transporter (DMT)-like permease